MWSRPFDRGFELPPDLTLFVLCHLFAFCLCLAEPSSSMTLYVFSCSSVVLQLPLLVQRLDLLVAPPGWVMGTRFWCHGQNSETYGLSAEKRRATKERFQRRFFCGRLTALEILIALAWPPALRHLALGWLFHRPHCCSRHSSHYPCLRYSY